MRIILDNFWLLLFVAWGMPLTIYRSRFRKIVYQTDNWLINIKPVFIKELKGLFGNIYPDNPKYIRFRNFYRFYLLIYFVLFYFYFDFKSYAQTDKNNDMDKIGIGSKIPSFALNDQNGKMFHIDSVKGKFNLVIYFYPKDDSPGCTKQACSFRDQFEVFRDLNALVIGVSSQSVESHAQFAAKHRLNYTLLSDEGNKVRKLFQVPSNLFGLIPGRVTYVINKQGEIVYMFNSQTDTEKHINESVKIIKSLNE